MTFETFCVAFEVTADERVALQVYLLLLRIRRALEAMLREEIQRQEGSS